MEQVQATTAPVSIGTHEPTNATAFTQLVKFWDVLDAGMLTLTVLQVPFDGENNTDLFASQEYWGARLSHLLKHQK